MSRPRKTSDHHRRQWTHAIQAIRLKDIAAGTREPEGSRERLYLYLLRDNDRPDVEDFILSEPLWRLERLELKIGNEASS